MRRENVIQRVSKIESIDAKKITKETCSGCYDSDTEPFRCKKCSYKVAMDVLKEIQQYRALGTVEELRELKSKNEPKQLLTREDMYPNGYGMYSTQDRWCPTCKGLVFSGDWYLSKQKILYKRRRCSCGQVLDWKGCE